MRACPDAGGATDGVKHQGPCSCAHLSKCLDQPLNQGLRSVRVHKLDINNSAVMVSPPAAT
jgi:hypothetical protein